MVAPPCAGSWPAELSAVAVAMAPAAMASGGVFPLLSDASGADAAEAFGAVMAVATGFGARVPAVAVVAALPSDVSPSVVARRGALAEDRLRLERAGVSVLPASAVVAAFCCRLELFGASAAVSLGSGAVRAGS